MLSSQQHQLRASGQGSSSSSSGSIPPGALTFTSTDGSGQRFSSPFGDLHLIPPELQTAFVRQMNGGNNPSSGFGGHHVGVQQGESQGSVDTANVFKMPLAGRGVALSGDVSGDEDDEDDAEDGDEGNGDDGGDNDEDEGDDTLGAPSQKRTRTASAKANGAAAAARIPPRRSSKSSSSTSSSTPAGAGKSAALSKGKAPETGEVTPKAPSAAKGRAAAASKATAAAAAAATTATAGASGSAATKKKSASEVKGERDSLTGRRKIKIQFIEDDSRRHITFSKRKAGIMKKAYELSVLTGTQVLLLIVSQTGLVFTFTTPKLRPVVMETEGRELIQRCLSAPDDEDADEEEEPAEAYAGGDGSDDEDDDEVMSMPQSPPMSPSKGPVAILRPGPTMTASGGTPKRSGGGTGDGGAAGRRSRAATMSNATVRQQKNSVGSPEHAVAGLSLPATPATPTAATSAATPTTSASRSKKRRRTHAGGSATPGATAVASPSMMQPPASSALLTAISSPHANSAPPRPGQPLHPQRMPMQQPGQTPNSAPPHFSSLPPEFQPPPHIQQYGGQFHDGKHDGSASPFLMGPNGGMGSDGMGGQSHNPTEFLFSPVDLSSTRSMQQMQQQQQHLSPFHGGNNTLYSSGSSNPSPNNTLTDGSSGSSSGGPGTGSSSGYSPAMNSNASLFPSFGQVYAGYTGSSQGIAGQQQQQHVKNGGGSMSSHHSTATLYSPSLGQNASLHHSSQLQQQQLHHQQQLQQHLAQQQQQQQQQGSPWGDSMGLPPTPSGGLGLTPQFNSSANGGMSASGSSEFTNSNYWG